MSKLKVLLLSSSVLLAMLAGVVFALGYHGERRFLQGTAHLPPPSQVVDNARILSGAPYDPLMGKFGDVGARLGFIVCSDVPNIAYGLAGFSLQQMLEEDFHRDPSPYEKSEGNRPDGVFFHRRARNLHAFFQARGSLLPPTAAPRVGDLVFYRTSPKGYVSHVALVTETSTSGYRVFESAPETFVAQELPGSHPLERGWILVGFGRMYGIE